MYTFKIKTNMPVKTAFRADSLPKKPLIYVLKSEKYGLDIPNDGIIDHVEVKEEGKC